MLICAENLEGVEVYLREFVKALIAAERTGAERDEPEGARYIMISDTLARRIAQDMETAADIVELGIKNERCDMNNETAAALVTLAEALENARRVEILPGTEVVIFSDAAARSLAQTLREVADELSPEEKLECTRFYSCEGDTDTIVEEDPECPVHGWEEVEGRSGTGIAGVIE